MSDNLLSAEERKRKRLEAWKQKVQQKQPKVKLSLAKNKAAPKKKRTVAINPFLEEKQQQQPEETASSEPPQLSTVLKRNLELLEEPTSDKRAKTVASSRRWDNGPEGKDALDQFMEKLQAAPMGNVRDNDAAFSVHTGGSMMNTKQNHVSGGVITQHDLIKTMYNPKDWMSDSGETTDDEKEEQERRALIEALKQVPTKADEQEPMRPAQLLAEVKDEKSRRAEYWKELERQAQEARRNAEKTPELGRLYNDSETNIIEEAEHNWQAAQATPDALDVLAELNKKKELKAVDHSKIEYMPFQKNLYRVPRSLAGLTHDEVVNRRAKLKVRVRGHGAPAPVSTFDECGLSERIIQVLKSQRIEKPFPVQAQCIPCIMAGRDVIGIAKTGSGKTLAYVLPLLRHISVQPPLEPHESGPIGLILAPARELAFQIHIVCKALAKPLGLK